VSGVGKAPEGGARWSYRGPPPEQKRAQRESYENYQTVRGGPRSPTKVPAWAGDRGQGQSKIRSKKPRWAPKEKRRKRGGGKLGNAIGKNRRSWRSRARGLSKRPSKKKKLPKA